MQLFLLAGWDFLLFFNNNSTVKTWSALLTFSGVDENPGRYASFFIIPEKASLDWFGITK